MDSEILYHIHFLVPDCQYMVHHVSISLLSKHPQCQIL